MNIVDLDKVRKRRFQSVKPATERPNYSAFARCFDTEGNLLVLVTYHGNRPMLYPANWDKKRIG